MSGLTSTLRVATQGSRVAIPTSGLVAYYDPNQTDSYPGSGGSWFDLTDNNYTLTKESGIAWISDSPSYWNDTGGRMVRTDLSGEGLANVTTNSFSITMVMKLTSTNNWVLRVLRGNYTETYGTCKISVVSNFADPSGDYRINFGTEGTGGTVDTATSDYVGTRGEWNIWTMVQDWSNGDRFIYRNGLNAMSVPQPNPQGSPENYGELAHTLMYENNGQYGPVLYHNRALTGVEVSETHAFLAQTWN